MKARTDEQLLEMSDVDFVKYVEHWWGHVYRASVPREAWTSRKERDQERLNLLKSLRALHRPETS